MIPARLRSTRLPRKPLKSIAGKPLVEWVWRKAVSLQVLGEVVVAADEREILDAVEEFGGRGVLTRSDHASGTDRVAEVAERSEYRDYEFMVNLQGDELFVPESAVEGALAKVQGGYDVGTAATAIADEDEWRDGSIVKVVRDDAGGALYFSRAPIPHVRADRGSPDFAATEGLYLRHVGIYAFSRQALRRIAALARHPLEQMEGLEQLRWLAAGLRIGVVVVEEAERGIDTPEDIERAEDFLRRRQSFP